MQAPPPTVSARRGFSLLEVMVAAAVLAILFAMASWAFVSDAYELSEAPLEADAALLVRGVVLDLEEHYSKEGFPENTLTDRSCELPREFERAYECHYDLERLDIDQAELASMAAGVLESMTQGMSDEANILQAFGMLAFLFAQGDVFIHPILCPMTPPQFIQACNINVQLLAQNMTGMISFFPMIIMEAANRTRKLRVRIVSKARGERGDKDPILAMETFIISIPEDQKALTEEGAAPEAGGTPGATPATPGTTPGKTPGTTPGTTPGGRPGGTTTGGGR